MTYLVHFLEWILISKVSFECLLRYHIVSLKQLSNSSGFGENVACKTLAFCEMGALLNKIN